MYIKNIILITPALTRFKMAIPKYELLPQFLRLRKQCAYFYHLFQNNLNFDILVY